MSYEFWIEAPQDSAGRPALTLGALVAELRQRLPGWAAAPVVSAQPLCTVLELPLLGAVQITAAQVLFGLGNQDFRTFLLAIRPVLLALAPLGFQGKDPQLGGRPVEIGEDAAAFLRQYRRLVAGSKAEFDYWCTTGIPPAWIEKAQAKERYAQACRNAFAPLSDLPTFDTLMAMAPAEVEAWLERLIAINDRGFADPAIGTDLARRGAITRYPLVRANGERLPMMEPWYQGSSVQQELLLLDVLLRRQHPRGLGWAALREALTTARAS